MSNERDTQFAGFASRLLQELLDQGAYVAISEWATGGDSFKSEQLIARRVYDLIEHTLQYVSEHPSIDDCLIHPDCETISLIPDMPTLPDTQSG